MLGDDPPRTVGPPWVAHHRWSRPESHGVAPPPSPANAAEGHPPRRRGDWGRPCAGHEQEAAAHRRGREPQIFKGDLFSKFIYSIIQYNVCFLHLLNLILSCFFGCQDFSSCGCWALRSFPLPSKSSLVTNSWPWKPPWDPVPCAAEWTATGVACDKLRGIWVPINPIKWMISDIPWGKLIYCWWKKSCTTWDA